MNARARLDAAYEEGQLGADEYHDRSDRAARAETLSELHRLVADLQASPGTSDLPLPQPDSVRPRRGKAGYPEHVRARDADRAATCSMLDAALGDGQLSDDDHRALTELAGAAKTLGELAELTADLQQRSDAPAGPRPPRSRHRQWFSSVVVLVTLVAGIAGFALMYRPAVDRSMPGRAELEAVAPLVIPTPSPVTVEGITLFRDNYRARFGDTMVDDVSFFPEHASVTRQSSVRDTLAEDYTYYGGFVASGDPSSRRSGTVAVDLASLDMVALERLIRSALERLGVEKARVSHINFDQDTGSNPRPSVTIYVDNEFKESAFLEATPAGEIIREYPFKK